MFRALVLSLTASFAFSSTGFAKPELTKDDLARLFPSADLRVLTPEELQTCLRSSQLCKLKATLDRPVGATASPAAASVLEGGPGFDDLAGTSTRSGLSDSALQECFGEERMATMSARTRDYWRGHELLNKFHGFYKSGKIKLEGLRDMAKNILESYKPPLVTQADKPLREQLPIQGTHFTLDLNTSTGWLFIEKDRKLNGRDQQVANVLWALADDDKESDIAELLERLAKLRGGKPVSVILNLKMIHRGNIATFDTFKVISLGMENPWLSVHQNLRYLRSVICHELGHFLQDELYGWKPAVGLVARFAGLQHNPEVTTNEQVALSEGWGDFCGVTFGKTDYWDWQEGYRHEGYDEKKPMKSRSDLQKTEGCVTRILMLSNDRISGFRDKVIRTMARHKPLSISALVKGFATDHPADAPAIRAAMEEVLAGSN